MTETSTAVFLRETMHYFPTEYMSHFRDNLCQMYHVCALVFPFIYLCEILAMKKKVILAINNLKLCFVKPNISTTDYQ